MGLLTEHDYNFFALTRAFDLYLADILESLKLFGLGQPTPHEFLRAVRNRGARASSCIAAY